MATKLSGFIIAIRVDRVGVAIALDNDATIGPLNNEFRLLPDHSQYNAIYSMALLAAANHRGVLIRIGGDGQIDPTLEATIKMLSCDFR
ncbi:hypothetical protein [Arthrobacter sp. MDT1-65]